ncbi:RelA/SpoT domain-containing protein [Candidatus Woesearchaeota archaeon]|nr:MAG: RelA/SpoT protein [archaeon GW2011_AR18]MBS3162126.1 RelA/SpoT domain-containing protein [Candidatus Woesearchaeota archaeon]HIH25244.1 RelA/SpoT domain-containing protein [Nanoarchaeota archaeon]
MTWVKPKGHSKSRINWAGDVLINTESTEEEKILAIEILDNWRAIHSYPMHIFKKRLKEKSRLLDKNLLTVQRLKRVTAILNKLKRTQTSTMNLSQMQDIGGCRAVLSNVALVRDLHEKYYLKENFKHKKMKTQDYISNPKNDGYRSLHLIYKYNTDRKGKKYYNGLLIEIQIRSRLQHLWATAVETVGFFTRQAIKSNEGHPDWAEFFKLISSAFAKMENCPYVPDTPQDEKELYTKIKEKEKALKIIDKLKAWTNTMRLLDEKIKAKDKHKVEFFLLELDIVGRKLGILTYTKEQEQKAIDDYSALEKRHSGAKDYDVVLVGADTSKDLKKAYPNYFLDTGDFLIYLQKIINKY